MAAPLRNVLRKIHFVHVSGKFRLLSSAVEKQTKQSSSRERVLCRTSKTDPSDHNLQHEGLYYTVKDDNGKMCFKTGQRPHLKRMIASFNETGIMIRKPALEIINCMKQANYDFPSMRYILYGADGTGKTISLGHVMHYCAQNGWLIIHIPWAPRFTGDIKEKPMSTSRPGRVDLPVQCSEWLNQFEKLNESFLAEHKPTIQGTYTWTKRDHSEKGTSWHELILLALERPKFSTDVMNVLLKEIKLQTSQKKFKTLVAMDGVNVFFRQTNVRREENPRTFYDPSEVSVVHNLKKLFHSDWSNGAVVCIVDQTAEKKEYRESDLPMYLLRKEGFELLDPFSPIHVENYSNKEMYSALEYYIDRQWIQNPLGATDEGRKEITFLSGKNPMELFRVTQFW